MNIPENKCKGKISLNGENINIKKLIEILLDQPWHKECEIVIEDDEVLVKYPNPHHDTYLRYSCGPKQGFFWDVYGDNMQEPELAIVALSQAPVPLNYRKGEYPIKFSLNLSEKK